MRTSAELIAEASPGLASILYKLIDLLEIIETTPPNEISRKIVGEGLKDELVVFLTTPPLAYTADQIDDFMSPTYQYPISGQLYSKIGNILQGVAPFYLDTVLQLIDNLKDVTPRVTANRICQVGIQQAKRFYSHHRCYQTSRGYARFYYVRLQLSLE